MALVAPRSGMAWWKRLPRRQPAAVRRARTWRIDRQAVRRHLAFAASRRGVEAYVEPPTNVTATTVILIAHDGEWTRRAAGSREAAFELARSLGVPVYDVNQTGYPHADARVELPPARRRR